MNVKTIYKKFLKWQRRDVSVGKLFIALGIMLAALALLLANG